ncbi:MAG: cytidine deaminase [Flavobacteriaceae bacterium]|nr:cytidine deaminase [Flavobacteriaceae bacterium]
MATLEITGKFEVFETPSALNPEDRKLLDLAERARNTAYAVYSEFLVGAAVLLDNGKIITGNNQENAAYPSGMCAERVAIWAAISQNPDALIKKIFISAKSVKHKVSEPVSPCGSCRQTIAEYEFRQKSPIAVYFTGETGKIIKANALQDLLPFAFNNTLL